MKRHTVLIERRFCGPPRSGNGGYVCGRLARFLDTSSVAVRLHVPPPLEMPLEVRASESGVVLCHGETVVAEAKPTRLALEPPVPPSHAEAEAASRRYRGFASHWFPTCFVCGPKREPNDGLCIFPGPLEDSNVVAATWTPDASLAPAGGPVPPEFLWAALDCPGAFAFPAPPRGAVLLGELGVELRGDVSVGDRCVLTAWEVAHEGRKHYTATALFDEAGACRGLGLGTWFEVEGATGTSG